MQIEIETDTWKSAPETTRDLGHPEFDSQELVAESSPKLEFSRTGQDLMHQKFGGGPVQSGTSREQAPKSN